MSHFSPSGVGLNVLAIISICWQSVRKWLAEVFPLLTIQKLNFRPTFWKIRIIFWNFSFYSLLKFLNSFLSSTSEFNERSFIFNLNFVNFYFWSIWLPRSRRGRPINKNFFNRLTVHADLRSKESFYPNLYEISSISISTLIDSPLLSSSGLARFGTRLSGNRFSNTKVWIDCLLSNEKKKVLAI